MIVELDRKNFYKCKVLVNEQGQLEVKAVIEGINPGRIFVDNANSPKSGLIWLGNNDGFFFIGNEENALFNNEINDFIDHFIIPEAKKVHLSCFEGIGNHPKWNTTIEKLFKHRHIKCWNQKVYTLQKGQYKRDSEPMIEQEYRVLKINKALYENNDDAYENIDFLRVKILEFWDFPGSFFNTGIGYCIVHKNKIVSTCFSGFVVENVHCVDIETLEEHRGKKLAQKIARSFVKECLKNDLLPYWDCMEENTPSVSIAENIGFTNDFNYKGYYFSFE